MMIDKRKGFEDLFFSCAVSGLGTELIPKVNDLFSSLGPGIEDQELRFEIQGLLGTILFTNGKFSESIDHDIKMLQEVSPKSIQYSHAVARTLQTSVKLNNTDQIKDTVIKFLRSQDPGNDPRIKLTAIEWISVHYPEELEQHGELMVVLNELCIFFDTTTDPAKSPAHQVAELSANYRMSTEIFREFRETLQKKSTSDQKDLLARRIKEVPIGLIRNQMQLMVKN